MPSLNRLFLALILACAALQSGCSLTHAFTKDELQAQLSSRFQFSQNAGLFSVVVRAPTLRLDGNTNRAGLSLIVEAAGFGRSTVIHADVEGGVDYHADTGAFFLRDADIKQLEFEGEPGEMRQPLALAADIAIRLALRDRPIYVLDPNRNDTEARIRGHLKRVWIEQDRMVVEYHL